MLRSFSRKAALAVVAFLVLLSPLSMLEAAARAKVIAHIDLSTQRMTVTVNGRHYGTWPVSTARRGYRTPRGTFRPKFLKRMHYSRKYYNSPMPWSVFFLGGYAIHGTNAISRLGRPASHGCIRLHPANAARLFSLIKQYGKRNTLIRITGTPKYTPWRKRGKKWKKRRRYRQKINLSSRQKKRRPRRAGHYANNNAFIYQLPW